MWKPSSSISTLALGAVLSTSLILGGCGKDTALEAMGLETSGADNMTWAGRTGTDGDYVFTNLTSIKGELEGGHVQKLTLQNVREEGGEPVFDKITFDGIALKNEDSDVAFESFSISDPSPALATAIGHMLKGDADALDNIEGDVSFSASHFTGLNITDEDGGDIKLDDMQFSVNEDGKGLFTFDNLEVDIHEEGVQVKLNLGSINVTGANLEKYKPLFAEAMRTGKNGGEVNEETVGKIMENVKPYDLDFDTYSMNDLHVNAMGFVANLDKVSGKAEKRDGKVYITQSMTPLTITPPKGADISAEVKPVLDMMNTLGYETLEFTSNHNTVIDDQADMMSIKDSYLQMKDGFKLSISYDMVGYADYMKSSMAQSMTPSSSPLADLEAMKSLKIKNMHFALRDDSIIERAIKLAAQMRGKSPEGLRAEIAMGMAFLPMMAQDEGQQKLANELSVALGPWLAEGGSLVIDMNPENALSFGDVSAGAMSGKFDVSTLGLSISHKK